MRLIKKLWFRQIAFIVAFSVLIIGAVPAKSMAYVIEADSSHAVVAAKLDRSTDMARVQRALEEKVVSDKLEDLGLTSQEIRSRLDKLSDTELHGFASQLDGLYPGGDGLGVVIGLLVIAILVVVLLKLYDKKIIIR